MKDKGGRANAAEVAEVSLSRETTDTQFVADVKLLDILA